MSTELESEQQAEASNAEDLTAFLPCLTDRVVRVRSSSIPISNGGQADVHEASLKLEGLDEDTLKKLGDTVFFLGGTSNSEQRVTVAIRVPKEHRDMDFTAEARRLLRHVRAWSKLDHPNILPLLGYAHNFIRDYRLASFVSPWMPLGKVVKHLEEKKAGFKERLRMVYGISKGLAHMRKESVIHGDLKGDNILIDHNYEPRIADFGLSRKLDEQITISIDNQVSSSRWIARECIAGKSRFTFESDIWALGMTAYELITGKAPFSNFAIDAQVLSHLLNGGLPLRPIITDSSPSARLGTHYEEIYSDVWDLIEECWNDDPKSRPTAEGIEQRLCDIDRRLSRSMYNDDANHVLSESHNPAASLDHINRRPKRKRESPLYESRYDFEASECLDSSGQTCPGNAPVTSQAQSWPEPESQQLLDQVPGLSSYENNLENQRRALRERLRLEALYRFTNPSSLGRDGSSRAQSQGSHVHEESSNTEGDDDSEYLIGEASDSLHRSLLPNRFRRMERANLDRIVPVDFTSIQKDESSPQFSDTSSVNSFPFPGRPVSYRESSSELSPVVSALFSEPAVSGPTSRRGSVTDYSFNPSPFFKARDLEDEVVVKEENFPGEETQGPDGALIGGLALLSQYQDGESPERDSGGHTVAPPLEGGAEVDA